MKEATPRYVIIVSNGKGGRFAYFRSKETGRIRLKGLPGDPGFYASYDDARQLRDRLQRAAAGDVDQDSFAWLVDSYLKSAEYKALADPTQADYAKTCALLVDELGMAPFRCVTRTMIKMVRDDLADTARKANKVQQMASRIYSWAQEGELVPDGFNPAQGLKRLKRKGGEREIVPWSDAEIAIALADAPLPLKTVILVALYTGQRREDVAGANAMTWQQDQGAWLRVRTSKTRTLVDLPCHPVLRAHLDALPKLRGVIPHPKAPICCGPDGKPWPSVNAMSGQLRRFVEQHPRLPNNRSMHGLRYAAAARMEEGGAGVADIEAVLGHRTFKMALKYASRRKRAEAGVAAMKGEA